MSSALFSLKGKVALVTGATNGIGRGMVTGLAEAKIDQIIFIHRPSTDPQSTIDSLIKAHPNPEDFTISTIEADLGSLKIEDIESKIVKKSLQLSKTGKIDILINNAGISYRSPIIDYPDDEFNKVLHVNLNVPTKLSQLIGKHMIENKIRGKILFTASLLSFQGGVNVSAYAVSKGGILQLTKALSNEWASYGINVNSIAPGYIKTNMTRNISDDEKRNNEILSRIPYGRWGDIFDFKGPTVFLASSASDYVSGESLVVDGGWMGR
ncbi:hypothetical protein PACTADRAFT_51601 [Pachysolen tannophilus NRRL Y-2460]|uniref:2-deoxy-D-gluconate 3-dehydrogenase n=1 Tax=Pachysolen tannophilus NRRL Y-2460 TaxID=669874 RepID=A0A1E4TQ18_PACTA|nr:hypothetical protein PACTADRAFT_51601 [Pachysolen tannophilus NRRL Y-2460]